MANPYTDRYNELQKALTTKYGTTPLIGRGKGFNFAQYKKQNRVYDSEKKIWVDRRNPDKEWTDKYNSKIQSEYNSDARVLRESFKSSLWINQSGDRRAIKDAENLLRRTKSGKKPLFPHLLGGKTLQGESLATVKYNEQVAAAEANLNKVKLGIETKAFTPTKDEAALLPKPTPAEVVDQTQDAVINETKKKLDGNNKTNNNKPLISGQEVGRGTWVNGRWVDQGTSKPLMSSFKENASDQARNNLKVKQDAGETTYKSDVHTIDPDTGEPRGVLTRSQAKAFDAKHQEKLKEWANKPGNELRIYKNHQGAG